MNKRLLKSIAFVLAVCFLSQMLPLSVFAQAASRQGRTEVAGMRTRNLKTTKNDDGTTTATISAAPLQFLDKQGNWKDIDNSLVPTEDRGMPWANASNRFRASFAGKASADTLVIFSYEGHYVEFSLPGASGSEPEASKNQVHYCNALPNADIEYTITDTGVKEEIILHEPGAVVDPIDFRVNSDLNLLPNAEGGIDFTDPAVDPEYPYWTLTPAYMIDAAYLFVKSLANAQARRLSCSGCWQQRLQRIQDSPEA